MRYTLVEREKNSFQVKTKTVNRTRMRDLLASCLIYARAFVEYVYGCVLFQDVTVREIRGR